METTKSEEEYYQIVSSDLELKKETGSRMKRLRKKLKRWFSKLFSSHRISRIDLGSKSSYGD
ncbi:hypothetical protein FACS189421_09130 [Bacteroidia bacterium]|nr:hypothetical protein FACS189421_09130 [Bacteroidia bacterium]